LLSVRREIIFSGVVLFYMNRTEFAAHIAAEFKNHYGREPRCGIIPAGRIVSPATRPTPAMCSARKRAS
jgi:hypothetical protein